MSTNVENLIAKVVNLHDKKRKQLEKVAEISCHLTSDAGIAVKTELYNNNICRFLITGTRCGMTITYNMLTWEIVRKPRGAAPWYTEWESANAWRILERAEELKEWREKGF